MAQKDNCERFPKRVLLLLELYAGVGMVLSVTALSLLRLYDLLFSIALFCIIAGALFFSLFWIPFYYNSYHYQISEEELLCKRGVIFRRTYLLRKEQIVCFSFYKDPLSSLFKLNSALITVAGTSFLLPFLTAEQAFRLSKTFSQKEGSP